MAAQPVQAARAPDRARNRRRARAGALRRAGRLPAGRRRHPPRPVRGRRCRNLPHRYRSAGNARARQAGNAGRGRARRGLGMGGGRAASGLRGTAGVPERPAPPPRADHPRGPPHRLAGNPPRKDRRRTGRSLRRRGRGQGREAGTAARSGGRRTARRGECLARLRPEVREVAGAIVTIDRNGEVVIHRGLLREAEARRCARWKSCGAASAAPKAKPPTRSTRTPTTRPRPRACPTSWRSG